MPMAQVVPAPTAPTILVREGKDWRQYMVITDDRCAIVYMTPALWAGWKFDRVYVQGHEDWCGWSRDTIVAFKFESDDGLTRYATDLGEFRDALITRANGAL
jgi:hypothetical protein